MAQTPVEVRITPSAVQVAAGDTVDVAVEVVDVQGLYGFDVSLAFDPAVVEVVDADPGLGGIQVALGLLLDPGFVILNAADNDAGTVRFAMTQMNPSEPKSGTGALIVVKLRGKQAGAATPVTLTDAQLVQRDGTKLPTTLVSGQVEVTEPGGQPTNTPMPTQGPGTPMPTLTPETPEPTPTNEPQPTATSTPGATATSIPATSAPESTSTAESATATNLPPTAASPGPSPIATGAPLPSPTLTPLPPPAAALPLSATPPALADVSAAAPPSPTSGMATVVVQVQPNDTAGGANESSHSRSITLARILIGSGICGLGLAAVVGVSVLAVYWRRRRSPSGKARQR